MDVSIPSRCPNCLNFKFYKHKNRDYPDVKNWRWKDEGADRR